MALLLISAIPLFLLLIFGNRAPNNISLGLALLSIPFFIQLAFYGIILGIGIFIATIMLWHLRKWVVKRRFKKSRVEIMYDTRR